MLKGLVIEIIDARLVGNPDYHAKYILLDGRGFSFIINKYSAQKNLDNINEANVRYINVNTKILSIKCQAASK